MAIRIGTSGFSFQDWKGPVYPQNISAQEMLPYYERNLGFNTLEVNFTYYSQPTERTMASLTRRTGPHFGFVVKCHKQMTHEIRDENGNLVYNEGVFSEFKKGIQPMLRAGKLGCVLAQFPPTFVPGSESKDYIVFCKNQLGEVPLIIEFRNRAWLSEETFEFLQENGLGYCCVDEPRIDRLMPFVPRVTGRIAYFRFHGRNRNWFRVPASERYNYLYSDEELKEFIPAIEDMAGHASETYVFFNNCHAGSAALNARRLKEIMGLSEGGGQEEGQMEFPSG